MNEKLLREYVRGILNEKTSALKSEVNLKDAINRIVSDSGGSVSLNLGDFGVQTVTGAAKAGGGNPEPKADIIILTKAHPDGLGISMKAPNYDFIQNRMQTAALDNLLTSVGVNSEKKLEIIEKLRSIVKKATEEKEENIKKQRDDFFKAVNEWGGEYSFPDKLWKEIKDENSKLSSELIKTGSWTKYLKGVKARSIIPTVLVNIQDLLNEKEYSALLRSVIAGDETNPRKADGMLISLVPEGISEENDLQGYLDDIKNIDSALSYYKDKTAPPRIRMIYRSQIASRLSKTESGRYDNTKDAILTISVAGDTLKWYVSIVK
jgi:hypothetical protein